MRAGKRRHLITIQQKTAATDPQYGGVVFIWAGFAKAWSAIRMSRGRELIAAQAAKSEMIGTFNVRWISGVTQDMRIVYNGQYYDITAVVDINEQHREMDIMVSSGLNDG